MTCTVKSMEPHFHTLLNTVYFQFIVANSLNPEQNRLSNADGLRIIAHLNSENENKKKKIIVKKTNN